jgi:hypothetical protein
MGRPVKYDDKKLEEIRALFAEYIENTDIPIVAEFAYQNKIPRQKLYEFEALNDTLKGCIDKKEAQLERMGLRGEVDKTMAIFSLKQLGWSDKQQVEHSGGVSINVQADGFGKL